MINAKMTFKRHYYTYHNYYNGIPIVYVWAALCVICSESQTFAQGWSVPVTGGKSIFFYFFFLSHFSLPHLMFAILVVCHSFFIYQQFIHLALPFSSFIPSMLSFPNLHSMRVSLHLSFCHLITY